MKAQNFSREEMQHSINFTNNGQDKKSEYTTDGKSQFVSVVKNECNERLYNAEENIYSRSWSR